MTQEIEEEPGGENADAREKESVERRESSAGRAFLRQNPGETGCAKHPSLVFGDAFAAEKAAATRATRCRLARGMIPTTLGNKIHRELRCGARARGHWRRFLRPRTP